MLRLVWDNEEQTADLSVSTSGTDTTRPLDTAVILSLFCDARALKGDDLQSSLGGWWAQAFFDDPDDVWGSRLWQVQGKKATKGTLQFAQRACEAALQWMVDDGVVDRFEVETWWIEGRRGYLGILVRLYRPGELDPQYAGPWSVYYAVE